MEGSAALEIKIEPTIKIEPVYDDYIEEKTDMRIKIEDVKQEVIEPEFVVIKTENNYEDLSCEDNIKTPTQPSNSACDNSSQVKGNDSVNFTKKCLICNIILVGKGLYLRHMMQHKKITHCDSNASAPVPCKKVKVEVKSEDEVKEKDAKKSVWQCGECRMYVSGEDKNRHLLSHQRHQCKLCGLKFFLKDDLSAHTEQVHQTNLLLVRGITCHICDESMMTKAEREIHVKVKHCFKHKFL